MDDAQMESTLKIKNCDAVDNQKQFHCINKFIDFKMNRTSPWLDYIFSKRTKNSTENIDVTEYLLLSKKIYTKELKGELLKFGCLIENCHNHYWKMKNSKTYTKENLKNSPELKAFLINGFTAKLLTLLNDHVSIL